MPRTLRWCATFALALLLAPLAACEPRSLTLRFASFGAGEVDGIWLWRLAEATGRFERACRIDFDGPYVEDQVERVGYRQACLDAGLALEAEVARPADSPEAVLVDLWYLRWEESGTYKASLFGASGESALSTTAVTL
jgi:hypothetical protein